jgi:hypothetical protein
MNHSFQEGGASQDGAQPKKISLGQISRIQRKK